MGDCDFEARFWVGLMMITVALSRELTIWPWVSR